MNDYFKKIFAYLKSVSIEIDESEFVLQINSHPNFPSALALSDTLSFFNIDNSFYHVEMNELLTIDVASFLTQIDGEYIAVTKNGNQFRIDNKVVTINYFQSKWDGLVIDITADYSQDQTRKNNEIIKYIVTAVIIILILFNLFISQNFLFNLSFLSLIIAGFVVSTVAYRKSQGLSNSLIDGFCKNEIINSSCDAIFTTKKWKVLNYFDLTKISLLFFIIQFIQFIFLNSINSLDNFYYHYKYLLFMFIPISIISIYYQIFVERKICPLCMLIISIVYCEIFLISYFDMYTSRTSSIFPFLMPAVIFLFLFIKYLEDQKSLTYYKKEYVEFKRFRKNYPFFINNILSQKKLVSPKNNFGLTIGNIDSAMNITIFTNPNCKHCRDLFQHLKNVFKEKNLLFTIYLDYNPEIKNDDFKIIYGILISTYLKEGEAQFLKKIYEWYDSSDQELFIKKYSEQTFNFKIENILKEHNKWATENSLNFTPILFINDYQYPVSYRNEDLGFFVKEVFENLGDDDFPLRNKL